MRVVRSRRRASHCAASFLRCSCALCRAAASSRRRSSLTTLLRGWLILHTLLCRNLSLLYLPLTLCPGTRVPAPRSPLASSGYKGDSKLCPHFMRDWAHLGIAQMQPRLACFKKMRVESLESDAAAALWLSDPFNWPLFPFMLTANKKRMHTRECYTESDNAYVVGASSCTVNC